METSPFICRANQWTSFYMIGTSVMKKLTWMFNSRNTNIRINQLKSDSHSKKERYNQSTLTMICLLMNCQKKMDNLLYITIILGLLQY